MSKRLSAPLLVLLHGLGRTRVAMLPLAWRLKRAGYEVVNLGYFGPRGLDPSVESVAKRLAAYEGRALDFVTHSMGGIVARAYLSQYGARHPQPEGAPRRLVQLAPPNQGATLADRVRRLPLLARVPAFRDLGYAPGVARRVDLPELPCTEIGVIAGQSFGPWLGAPGDGIVCLQETYLREARDWIVLPHFHTMIMNGRDTFENVLGFLREGSFDPEAARLTRTVEAPAKGRLEVGADASA